MTEVLSSSRREDLIRRSFLFQNADQEAIDRLVGKTVTIKLKKHEDLFQEGDEGSSLFIVIEGLIRIWLGTESGKELTLAISEAGDVIGEIALLDGLPRSAGATAMENCELLVVHRSDFLGVLEAQPRLAVQIIEILCERVRRNTETIGDFAFLNLRGRLARRLCELAIAHGDFHDGEVELRRRFSQSDLAAMLGVSREAVNKQLAALSDDKLVEIRSGRLHILDLPALQHASTDS